MTKKLISYDDQKPGLGLPDAVEERLNATYVRHLPGPTGDPATDTAMLLSYASTPGRNILREGVYRLNQPLPVTAGVEWVGIKPALRQVERTTGTWLADGVFDFESGTVFEGDGTFAIFEANTEPLAEPPAEIGDDEIPGFNLYGIGFDNATYGIHVGAQNHMGISHGNLESLYFKRCSQWAVKLTNFAQMHFDDWHSCLCRGSYFFGTWLGGFVFQPGNSTFGRIYAYTVYGTRKSQGIVFDCRGQNGLFNHMDFTRLQVNMFGAPLLEVEASFTSGSTAIGVPDGAEFEPGMLVQFTTTVAGVTAGVTYYVQSVTGNTITIGMASYTTPISATATTAATLKTHGYPQLAYTSDGDGRVNTSTFMNIDLEGSTTAKIYAERIANMALQIAAFARESLSVGDIVLRNVANTTINAPNTAGLDMDSSRDGVFFTGFSRGFIGGIPRGSWYDLTRGVFELNVGTSSTSSGADLQGRQAGFLYPGRAGVGERINPSAGTTTLDGRGGNIVARPTGPTARLVTLPKITPDDDTPNISVVGQWYRVVNLSPNETPLELTTSDAQTFNFVTGFTSITIPKGSAIKVVAIRDHNNNLSWLAGEMEALPTGS